MNISCSSFSPSKGKAASPENANKGSVTYKQMAATSWELSTGQTIEARLEEATIKLADLPPDKPKGRLVITNLTNGKVLFEKGSDDNPLSVSKANFYLGDKDVLTVTWIAGSAEGLEVYTVSAERVEEVLHDSFRDAYILLLSPESGEKTDILIVDKSLEDSRLEVRMYRWGDGKYLFSGVADYEEFIRGINGKFRMRQKH